jgi:hypothetical protein
MKPLLIVSVMVAGMLGVQAQERLSREEALKYACIVSLDLKEMLNTPIPTDPDIKRPVALKQDNHGGMILPEAKLTAQTFASAGDAVKAVAQLWLVNLVPVSDGQPVSVARQRMVHVRNGTEVVDAACCALGVRKTKSGDLELLVFGKDKVPLLSVPLKPISAQQDNPIEGSSEMKNEAAEVTLRFVGKYEATLSLTEPR